MIHVSCAIILNKGKVLICQRSPKMSLALKWEFPGGKVEEGESKEQCLKREIKEELGLGIQIQEALPYITHHYPDFSITLYPFICKITSGEAHPFEHSALEWSTFSDLLKYDWAEADIPIIHMILKHGNWNI